MLGIDTANGPVELRDMDGDEDTRTSQLVTGMWERTAESPVVERQDALTDWVPTELSPTAASKRRIRWFPTLLTVVVIGLLAFGLWWLPKLSERRADMHQAKISSALADLHGDLASIQTALATATEPASTSDEIADAAVLLAGFADSGGEILRLANEPLPAALPLANQARFDRLAAARDALEPFAAEADDIRGDIAAIAEYRLLLDNVLDVGELPTDGDPQSITQLGAELSNVLADSVSALNAMSPGGLLADHRDVVDTEITAFAQWQDDYLSALRDDDAERAGRLIRRLNRSRQQMHDTLVPILADQRSSIDERIVDLARRIGGVVESG